MAEPGGRSGGAPLPGRLRGRRRGTRRGALRGRSRKAASGLPGGTGGVAVLSRLRLGRRPPRAAPAPLLLLRGRRGGRVRVSGEAPSGDRDANLCGEESKGEEPK